MHCTVLEYIYGTIHLVALLANGRCGIMSDWWAFFIIYGGTVPRLCMLHRGQGKQTSLVEHNKLRRCTSVGCNNGTFQQAYST